MRLRRLSLLALVGVGAVVAACEPDNIPDLTAPAGYTLDLRTTPTTATLGTAAADSATGVRVFTAVHNTAIADTTLQRLGIVASGLTYTMRFQDPADTLKFNFGPLTGSSQTATRLTGNLYGRYAPVAIAATPGLYTFLIRRNRTTSASAGTANVIVEFTDVNNGNQLLADTIRVTAN